MQACVVEKIKTVFKAFTLAEVLIVLGIIGLIADMTIPTLMQSYEKQVTLTRFKKAYTVLNQALKMSEIENDSGKFWESTNSNSQARKNFKKYWAPYLRIQKYCTSEKDCGYKKSAFNCYNKSYPNQIGIASSGGRPTVVLNDGMIFQATGATTNEHGDPIPYNYMWIDVNGAQGPNTYGKDVFRFHISNEGKGVIPMGTGLEDNEIDTNCLTYGFYCGAKILKDGWQITYR